MSAPHASDIICRTFCRCDANSVSEPASSDESRESFGGVYKTSVPGGEAESGDDEKEASLFPCFIYGRVFANMTGRTRGHTDLEREL
jgi:hypothetical protein